MFGIDTVIEGASKLIGNFKLSPEDKRKYDQGLSELKNQAVKDALDYESKIKSEQASIIRAEAKGAVLAAIWRPITMLLLVSMVALHWFGLANSRLEPQEISDVIELIKLGLGGYIAGRSVEKIVQHIRR